MASTIGAIDAFSLLVVANFAIYYGDPNGNSAPGEWGFVLPQFAAMAMPEVCVRPIIETLNRYGRIPDEV